MSDFEIVDTQPERESPEPTNWASLAEKYDWMINISTDPEDNGFQRGLDVVAALRKQYGHDEVVVNRGSMDPDTLEIVTKIGRLGVHIRKNTERREV